MPLSCLNYARWRPTNRLHNSIPTISVGVSSALVLTRYTSGQAAKVAGGRRKVGWDGCHGTSLGAVERMAGRYQQADSREAGADYCLIGMPNAVYAKP